MATADKCFLTIPFKEYLAALKVDADGKVDQKALNLAASQEFENYKAIERRINDPACGGAECGCSWMMAQGAADTGGDLSLVAATNSSREIAFYGPPLEEQGGWTITGGGGAGVIVPPNPNGLYHVDVLASFTQSSGTDPVVVHLQILDAMTTWVAPSAYVPAGFGDIAVIASRIVALGQTPFGISVIMDSASGLAVSRSLGIYIEITAHELCGCERPAP